MQSTKGQGGRAVYQGLGNDAAYQGLGGVTAMLPIISRSSSSSAPGLNSEPGTLTSQENT